MPAPLGWLGIVRIGLVQTALGAVVVLTTSTLNRVMVIEIGLPAMVPGLLVAMHYAVQILRPRWGYGSDRGGRRTPWIVGGMTALAAGGALAAMATALMSTSLAAGLALAVVAFLAIGVGVGAAGTSLLVLLAERAAPTRRAAAAGIVWMMMIAGFAITAISAGKMLDPYSPARLVMVTSMVSLLALVVSLLAIAGIEGEATARPASEGTAKPPFVAALRQVWSEPQARRFTIFIFISMIAYNAQDLILEPFAGAVFGMTPGQSTQLGGMQHAGVLLGMVIVTIAGSRSQRTDTWLLKCFMTGGCLASAIAMLCVAAGGIAGPGWPITACVFALGVANGCFSIAAIGCMMAMAHAGREAHEGTRMGLWGAAQAIAFALGGLLGTIAADLARALLGSAAAAYTTVFAFEALAFVAAAILAAAVARGATPVAVTGGRIGNLGETEPRQLHA